MKKNEINFSIDELLSHSEESIQTLSYEEAMAMLEQVVNALEKEGTPINHALKLYELGMALSKRCSLILESTEKKMIQLLGDQNEPKEVDFDPEKDGR